MTNQIEIIQHQDIAELRMVRPPVNALNTELVAGLREALADQLTAGARAIVLTGREGLFSAGLDVPELLGCERANIETFWLEFFCYLRELAGCPVPVAAAVAGHAPAGGAVIALHCDYRVAAQGEFRIGLNEAQIGLPVPPSIFAALEWSVGARQAELLVCTGTMVTPERALEIGLVDEVTATDNVLAQCLGRLSEMLALPPVAMNTTRQTARSKLLDSLGDPAECARLAADSWFSDEAQACLGELVARLGKSSQ